MANENLSIQDRLKEFNKKLSALCGEYNLGISAQAFVSRDGRIFARPNVFDANDLKPRPSSDQLQPESVESEPPGVKVEGGLSEA